MSREDRQRWNRKWSERADAGEVNPLLRQYPELLSAGLALDLACGRGQNAIWLARHGYQVVGVDISQVALRAAHEESQRQGVGERTLFVQVDLDRWRPPPNSFDLIAIFRFLDRDLYAPVQASLRPGGLLFYETRHQGVRKRLPDANPTYLLQRGELRAIFAHWQLLLDQEGPENACLIAQKPADRLRPSR